MAFKCKLHNTNKITTDNLASLLQMFQDFKVAMPEHLARQGLELGKTLDYEPCHNFAHEIVSHIYTELKAKNKLTMAHYELKCWYLKGMKECWVQ